MLNILKNKPLAPLTTFEIGGMAQYFVDVSTEDEIREALAHARNQVMKFTILAGGSNVLVPDEGIQGLVIHITGGDFTFAGNELSAAAGVNLFDLIKAASKKGYGGWEKLAGIPGTIGGAVRGNAGAFGTEIQDIVVKVRALDHETGEMRDFENYACDFLYRHSFFKMNPEWIITRVYIELQKVDAAGSELACQQTVIERERRHLQNVRAAGSYFMNPAAPSEIVSMFEYEKRVRSREGRVPAGWLIEKAGMKGATVGGAMASPQHPNYLVNIDHATSADVLALADQIKEEVKKKFGVELKEEAALL